MRPNARFLLVLSLSIALGGLAASCGDNGPAGVYMDIQWTIRCIAMGGCTSYPTRDVLGFDGDNGTRLTCSVTESAANRTLTFSATAAGYGLSLRNATFARAGGTPAGTDCQVRVIDDNTYTGACGGLPPTETQPCQVNNVMFTRDAEGRSLITGNIYCQNISPEAAPSIDREVTGPGTAVADRTRPLLFNIYDCPGYNPD